MIFSKIHPLLIHFPIALFTSGTLLEVYGRLRKEEIVEIAGRFNVRFGFWWALLAMGVGFLGVLSLEIKDTFREFLSFHILFALSTIFLFANSLWLFRLRQKKWAFFLYHVCILVGMITCLITGYFGGELVHRFGIATLQPLE